MKQTHSQSKQATRQVTKLVPADSDDPGRFRRAPVGGAESEGDTGEQTARAMVSGRVFTAIPEAVAEMSGSFEGFTRQLLREAELTDIEADDWYPQAALVRFLRYLRESVGGQTVERLGRFLPTLLPWPDSVGSLRDALQAVDSWYRTWTRDDGATVAFTPSADHEETLVLDTPYPVEFERGLARGLRCQFESTATGVGLQFQDATTDGTTRCRFTFGGSGTR